MAGDVAYSSFLIRIKFCNGEYVARKPPQVIVFGEAAMFTAQINENNIPVGFGFPKAKQNEQFTLNIIHWLDRIIE